MATSSAGKSGTELDTQSLRDSFIPTFDGTTTGYREWRKRIVIYAKKMELSKRTQEAVLNLLGSLQGTAWRIVEDFDRNKVNDPEAFENILKQLDAAFQYENEVEMPADFTAYFDSAGRRPGQSLLQFVTEHDEKLRRLEKHKVVLPPEVQGWYLLNRANLSREQKQMVMTQANTLKRTKIQESMFAILGQDYKSGYGIPNSRWSMRSSGKGRGYCADDETVESVADDWADYDEDDYMGTMSTTRTTPIGRTTSLTMTRRTTKMMLATMILRWTMSSTSPSTTPAMPHTLMPGRDSTTCEWPVDFSLWSPWTLQPLLRVRHQLRCRCSPTRARARKVSQRGKARTTSGHHGHL